LKAVAENYVDVMEKAAKENWPAAEIIEHFLDLELERRRVYRMEKCFKDSKLIEKTTIDQFDFDHHVSRKKQLSRILDLLTLGFIGEQKDVILIGNPGVGKSFLGKCIAYAATRAGIRTLFATAADMINHLNAARVDGTLLKKLHYYQSPALLFIDEIGYLPLGGDGSNLFFQVISARHEKKSTMITTNRVFADWSEIFDNTVIAAAIADRLVANSEPIILEGESYRKKLKRK
ncbi:MAG: ATP-binding protein, partial [Chloroflexi bacterium]|nr:ATP-binding protein [Chloroflexota bacterium]